MWRMIPGWCEGLAADALETGRRLLRRPAGLLLATLPAALAMSASAVLFSMADTVLFEPLRHVPNGPRLVQLSEARASASAAARRELIEAVEASSAITSNAWTGSAAVRPAEAEAGVVAVGVSPSFFATVGVVARHGRLLERQIDGGTAVTSVVIGGDLFRAQFGADLSIIGRTVPVAGTSVRVVGVLPDGFAFPERANLWTLIDERDELRTVPNLSLLAEDVSPAQAAGALPGVLVTPLSAALRPDGTPALILLLGGTLLLLVLSWLQVGGLLTARAAAGFPEVVLRLTLGASRWRLEQMYAVEAFLLGSASLVVALAALPLASPLVINLLPPELDLARETRPSLRTVLFCTGIAVLGIVILGAALRHALVRRVLVRPIQDLRLAQVSGGAVPVRRALLVIQVCLVTLMLYVTGLAFASYIRISSVDPGFETRGLLAWTIPNPGRALPVGERVAMVTDALTRLKGSAGIRAAAAAATRPVQIRRFDTALEFRSPGGTVEIPAFYNVVTEEFVSTVGARLIAGSSFEQLDRVVETPVVLVNQRLAAQIAPYGFGVGSDVELPGFRVSAKILGVIGNLQEATGSEPPTPHVFLLQRHTDSYWLASGFIRTENPAVGAVAVRQIVEDVWGPQPRATIVEMTAEVRRAHAPWRGRFALLAVIAALCIPVSVLGVSGALARETASRRYETAVRMCLGASPTTVRWLAVAGTIKAAAVGIAAGLALGWVAGTALSSSLYGVAPFDLAVSLAVCGLFGGCAGLLALRSARRASKIDAYAMLRT